MMKIYTLFFFCVLFCLPQSHADPSPYHMTEPLSIMPFKRIDKLVLVEASVDGQTGYFLFDTGVADLTLNDQHFGEDDDIGVVTKITDINGRRHRAKGFLVEQFRWGGLYRTEFLAPLLDLSGLEEILDVPLLGLIGQHVIDKVEVHIDFDRLAMALMRLDKQGKPVAAPYTEDPQHILPFHMEFYIPVLEARIGQLDLNLAFDSGASINMIDRRLRRDLPDDARRLMRIAYGGAISHSRAPFIAVNAIYLEDQFAVTAWRMAATRMKHFSKKDIEIDGLIGADLFRLGGVSINYQKKQIAVWINDNIFAHRYEMMPTPDGAPLEETVLASPEK